MNIFYFYSNIFLFVHKPEEFRESIVTGQNVKIVQILFSMCFNTFKSLEKWIEIALHVCGPFIFRLNNVRYVASYSELSYSIQFLIPFRIICSISLQMILLLNFDPFHFLLCNDRMNASAVESNIWIACGKSYIRVFYHWGVFEDAYPNHLYIYMNSRKNHNGTLGKYQIFFYFSPNTNIQSILSRCNKISFHLRFTPVCFVSCFFKAFGRKNFCVQILHANRRSASVRSWISN